MDNDTAIQQQGFQVAFGLYLQGTKNLREIAEESGTSPECVRRWAKENDWPAARKAWQEAEMERVRNQLTAFIREHRVDAVQRHLASSSAIEESVRDLVAARREQGLTMSPGALRECAVALKNATDVSARVLGLNDKSASVLMGETESQAPTAVQVNLSLSGGHLQPQPAGTNAQDVTPSVEALPPSRRGGTEVTRAPEPCPF